MSRSLHHGCKRACGLCRPHKLWKTNGTKNVTRRKLLVELEDRGLAEDEDAWIDLRELWWMDEMYDEELEAFLLCFSTE